MQTILSMMRIGSNFEGSLALLIGHDVLSAQLKKLVDSFPLNRMKLLDCVCWSLCNPKIEYSYTNHNMKPNRLCQDL